MTKEELIALSDLNREDNIKYISSEAQGIAIALNSDKYAPTLCKLERAYICGRRISEKQIKELEKENAELKKKVSFLEDNLRVARKDRENLQLDIAKGLKEFVKDYPATSLRFLANEKYVEQLTKAKDLLLRFIELKNKPCAIGHSVNMLLYENIRSETEQFLKEE